MRSLTVLLVLACLPALQACAPAIATGAGAAVAVANDRRTSGTYVEDEGIELKGANRLRERFGDDVHVNVTSYNRIVLITGEAPTEAAKTDVEKAIRSLPNVRNVYNEVAVAIPSSLGARANDTYLTSKVKTRFLEANKFNALHVKVVTEAGVVYLMGLVSKKEAEDAVEIARTSEGVKRVVKIFEYL